MSKETMKYVDLHLHTTCSDGMDDPSNVVRNCAMLGLDTIAITDHDTTEGYYEAKKEADKWGLEIITGVEISTRKYHILGYDFDIKNNKLQELLEYSRYCQEELTKKRINVLRETTGMPLTIEKVRNYFPTQRLGKVNMAAAMMMDYECRELLPKNNSDYIMKEYLGKNTIVGKTYFEKEVSVKDTIDAIHYAGGKVIIAHAPKDVEDMSEIEEMVLMGLDGIEIQPRLGERNIPFESYALEKGLLITHGSDFHGARYIKRTLLERKYAIEQFWKK